MCEQSHSLVLFELRKSSITAAGTGRTCTCSGLAAKAATFMYSCMYQLTSDFDCDFGSRVQIRMFIVVQNFALTN